MSEHMIPVRDRCGPHCVAPDEGERLFDEVLGAMREGKLVSLDFSGVETITSAFLNVAIGRLYGQLDVAVVDDRLRWEGVDEADSRLISLVVGNAKHYYKQSLAERERDARIVNETAAKNRWQSPRN